MHLQSFLPPPSTKPFLTYNLKEEAKFSWIGKALNLSAGVVKECFTKDVKVENVFIELFVDEEGNVSVGH